MYRIILTSGEPVVASGRISGLQVRVLEMARALLRHGCEVRVLAPPGQLPVHQAVGDLVLVHDLVAARQFRPDLWICHPLLLQRYGLLLRDTRLALDCYEAPFASFLHYAISAPQSRRAPARATYRREMAEYLWALSQADLVLSANERQRASLLTLLALLGYIDPSAPVSDRVVIVPSGAPAAPPARNRSEVASHRIGSTILWAGGAYPWFDLDYIVHACLRVVEQVPTVRFIFAGLHGRDELQGARQEAAERFLTSVRAEGALLARAEFVPWVPYDERAALYVRADVALSTHGEHLETYFAMRARIVDFIWAGLPLVSTGGDTLSEVLGAAGAARLVNPGDEEGLAQALVETVSSEERRTAMSDVMCRLAVGPMSWDSLIEPLLHACEAGRSSRPRRGESIPVLAAPARSWRVALERTASIRHRLRLKFRDLARP